MELSPGDIFDAETDKVPENVTAELQRQNYFPRQCELVTESEDLVISTAEEFYSLKLAGDHAYLVRDYIRHLYIWSWLTFDRHFALATHHNKYLKE